MEGWPGSRVSIFVAKTLESAARGETLLPLLGMEEARQGFPPPTSIQAPPTAPSPASLTLWLPSWEKLLVPRTQFPGLIPRTDSAASEGIAFLSMGIRGSGRGGLRCAQRSRVRAQSSNAALSPRSAKSWLGFGFLIILGGGETYSVPPPFIPNSTQVTFWWANE